MCFRFKSLPYGLDFILRVTRSMRHALANMRSGKLAPMGTGATLQEYLSVVGFDDWTVVGSRYGAAEQNST